MRPIRAEHDDGGATLIEVLVAVSILGIAFAATVGGMYSTMVASDINRKQATAATSLTSYAEAVKGDVYTACAATYAGTGFSAPAGFSKDPVVVAYWNGTTFTGACGTDAGLQRVTLSIRSNDSRTVYSVQIAKRRS